MTKLESAAFSGVFGAVVVVVAAVSVVIALVVSVVVVVVVVSVPDSDPWLLQAVNPSVRAKAAKASWIFFIIAIFLIQLKFYAICWSQKKFQFTGKTPQSLC